MPGWEGSLCSLANSTGPPAVRRSSHRNLCRASGEETAGCFRLWGQQQNEDEQDGFEKTHTL